MKRTAIGLLCLAVGLVLLGWSWSHAATFGDLVHASKVPLYQVEVVGQIPHNPQSFTQGLLYSAGVLYESTGLYGSSSLQKINPVSGDTLKVIPLDSALFGEGLTLCDGALVQLTWREETALKYQLDNLEPAGEWRYETEGWGLTTDGKRLIMTDGTAAMYFRSPKDFSLQERITVTLVGQPVRFLNELEYANGKVYANVLSQDYIVEIDPVGGAITGVIDAHDLRDLMPGLDPTNPLNGIAFDSTTGDFYVTGKLWPTIFRVRFVRNLGEK